MKLFFVVVMAACSFAVHADNYEACLGKNKFDCKEKDKPRDWYVVYIYYYTEKSYADRMQTLEEKYNALTEEIEIDFDSIKEEVRIVIDHLLKSAKTSLEKLSDRYDAGNECAEKYSAELEAADVYVRKELREWIATALQQVQENEAENRPILDEFARLTKEAFANCWSSGETHSAAAECIVAKGDEINDNLRTLSDMYLKFYPTLQERKNATIEEVNESFVGVKANTRKKIQAIVKKAEQCFATG